MSHNRQTFYKYVKPSTGELILKNQTIRWSAPSLFNDPFDVPIEIFESFSRSVFQKALAERLQLLARNPEQRSKLKLSPVTLLMLSIYDHSDERMKGELEKAYFERDTGDQAMPNSFELFRTMWRESHNDHRILCLSERWDSASMWDRYSEEHRGIVLEFSCIEEIDSVWLEAKEVTYSDNPLRAHTVEGFVDFILCEPNWAVKQMVDELSYTKTTDWNYEKEWRISSFRRPNEEGLFSDYQFDISELKSVILGKDTDEATQLQILGLIDEKYPTAEVWKATVESGRKLTKKKIR